MFGTVPFSGKHKTRLETEVGRWRMVRIGLEGLVELLQATPGFRFEATVHLDLQFVGKSSPGQLRADVLGRRSEALAPHLPQFLQAETVQTGDLGLERFFAIGPHVRSISRRSDRPAPHRQPSRPRP